MPAFASLDWERFDVFATIVGRGVAAVDPVSANRCEDWLRRHGYRVVALDFSQGIGRVVAQLGELLDWRRRFGYELMPESRHLMALHDGFDFGIAESGGVALVLHGFGRAQQEDEAWCRGLLGIVSEHSLRQLALGKRLLAVVVVTGEDDPVLDWPGRERAAAPRYRRVFR